MVDLLKPDVGKARVKHKIYKNSREEEDKAIEFQNIDSLECKDIEEAVDMYNHAYRNQLLYHEDLMKDQNTQNILKEHQIFAMNIDYQDQTQNKHFSSKVFIVEMAQQNDKFVDVGLLNSLQSKYLYLIGCLSPNAIDAKAMLNNMKTL